EPGPRECGPGFVLFEVPVAWFCRGFPEWRDSRPGTGQGRRRGPGLGGRGLALGTGTGTVRPGHRAWSPGARAAGLHVCQAVDLKMYVSVTWGNAARITF